MDKRIIIGSDGAGYLLKEAVKKDLISKGYEIVDIGTQDPANPMDYFKVGFTVGKAVSEKKFERGIVFCGSGMGVGITAGKYPNVYSAVCESIYAAQRCRVINNANVLAMGGQFVTPHIGVLMANAFLDTKFCEGLDSKSTDYLSGCLEEVKAVEKALYK
ncbi:MAG: RpiB/LacA/LacB family sugar-phosphate isomerase [Christensenellales bacterium]